ncbi:MAG: PfkB family carbohydrate kinase, partial [Chloroflexi bacterium]|nr:PfkB family carbohydrate kinase [Chloroflexota bacterium]
NKADHHHEIGLLIKPVGRIMGQDYLGEMRSSRYRTASPTVGDIDSAAQAASAIRRRGAGDVFVTLGAAGAWVDASSWCGHIPGYAVPVADTLGAGDTFAGALAVRLCEGADIRAAAEFAVAASALSVMRPGAQPAIPQRQEVEDFLAAAAAMPGHKTKQSRSSS